MASWVVVPGSKSEQLHVLPSGCRITMIVGSLSRTERTTTCLRKSGRRATCTENRLIDRNVPCLKVGRSEISRSVSDRPDNSPIETCCRRTSRWSRCERCSSTSALIFSGGKKTRTATSNPPARRRTNATNTKKTFRAFFIYSRHNFGRHQWRGDRVVEGTALEKRQGRKLLV